ncbi:hypothetical protein TIFTF001_032889 [Ficus carica]|uniref:MULE transposase domain-containing protein n=1 Tax=Ficus carica TaxID=3494 RepID=A0AA88DZF9_FICCA|nr:hypothetical protein TIFTF001_032889 [Ficus carica]
MCLAASKQGWPHCRPVIVVAESAIKARFGGMLLVACGHDADGSIFPLAFGIVPSETNELWKWFFEKLRDSIGTRESLAIVTDRHKGIEYTVSIVYPDVDFGICVQHLVASLKTMYKDFKGLMKTYFDSASRAYLVSEHQHYMESIRNRNPDMHRYLLQADPKKWSRAYFNGRRYAIMTINIVESLNSIKWKAKLMLVGFLVEWLRELLQRWFFKRREKALKLTPKLTPKAENFFAYIRRVEMFLKKSDPKLSILPRQSVVPEGQRFLGFCPKVRNQRLFDAADVMVIDTIGKLVLIQYHYA